MSFRVKNLSCDPPENHTTEPFRLRVELEQNTSTEVTVSLEKQRLVRNIGGQPELRPTGPSYFKLDPQPIIVAAGTNKGLSEPISVRNDATAEPGEPPVHFPEQLLFTAFGDPADRFRSVVVPILQPD